MLSISPFTALTRSASGGRGVTECNSGLFMLAVGEMAASDAPRAAQPAARARGFKLTRSTDRLIALQFLAVVVPIAFVLLAQVVADARRAAALAASRPLRTLA